MDTFEFQETIVRVKFSDDKIFEVEASEGYWTLQEMMDEAEAEFPGDPTKRDIATLELIRAWAGEKLGAEVSRGQADAIWRQLITGHEVHKKKLPELPESPTTTSSTQPSSTSSPSAPSPPTSPPSEPKTNSANAASREDLATS